MRIDFSDHTEEKINLLASRGFSISKNQIVNCLKNPDKLEKGYGNRKIAQKIFDETHVIRVVFEKTKNILRVITVYPGRRKRYEDQL